jgi:hypothetical protein
VTDQPEPIRVTADGEDVLVHLPQINYLDTQAWAADVGITTAALWELRDAATAHLDSTRGATEAVASSVEALQDLADLIEPALREVRIRFGPNALAMLQRGEQVGLSFGEYASLARAAAHAIIHRHDSAGGDHA